MTPRLAVPLVLLLALSLASLVSAATTERVSVSTEGVEATGGTDGAASVSADGRYVAFYNWASNLVENDTNTAWDVFVRDREANTTSRVSVSTAGAEGNGYSIGGTISGDGRYVAFDSDATNLVSGDDNDARDVFLRDRQAGTTVRVSVSTSGEQANGYSGGGTISADGSCVLFGSDAANLVSGDGNALGDLFVRDLDAGTTELVSVSTAGVQANDEVILGGISSDGRYVVFASTSTSLVLYDSNGYCDIFLRDRQEGTTERVNLSSEGAQANGDGYWCAISADGRFVAFSSDADNLVDGDTNGLTDVFVRDRVENTTERVSVSTEGAEGDNSSSGVTISADGRFVAFVSYAATLVPGDANDMSDIFIRDREAGVTTRVSLTSDGAESAGASSDAAVSADGRCVSFISGASDLVPDDTNSSIDVFLRDRQTFSDVPVTHWAFYQIEACTNSNIVAGYEGGIYQPSNVVSRAQMAVFVSRALVGGAGVPDPTTDPGFTDVDSGHWAYKYICYAVDQNIVAGFPEGDYKPNADVTRDQMAVFIARSICSPTGDDGLVGYVPTDPRNFPDVDSEYWAYLYVEYCVEQGVVNGYLDGTYRPDAVVTRDQMAIFVTRAFDLPI